MLLGVSNAPFGIGCLPIAHLAALTATDGAGATYAHKLRPVDVLEQILRENRGGKLEQFFALYGAPEASAMCYFLATAKNKNEVSLHSQLHKSVVALSSDQLQVTMVFAKEGVLYLSEGRVGPGCLCSASHASTALRDSS